MYFTEWSKLIDTICMVLDSIIIFNSEKLVKRLQKKPSADKCYQIANPDEFLFSIKF